PSLIFLVQSNTVETELYLGKRQEAHRRLDEATRLLAKLRPPPPLVAYQRAAAQVAQADGDFPAAIVFLERARREMESTGDIHGNSYAGLLSVLRLYHFLAGDLREAQRNALEMVDVHRRHHRENSVPGMISRGVLAMSYGDIGQVARSRSMLEEVFPELAHPDTAEPGIWLVFGWVYGEGLGRLGQGERALPLIRDSLDMVMSGSNRMNEIRARLALARTLLEVGRLKEAQAEVDTVVATTASDSTANRIWLIETDRLRAELDLRRARLDRAEVEARSALRRIGDPTPSIGPRLGPVLLTLARVQLARGSAEQALDSSLQASRVFASATDEPSQSADYGGSMLVAAQAQFAAGRSAEARRSLALAVPALSNGLGAAHELTHFAQELADR
ncbi:MAG TPA: hypothetical protein VKA63_01570, partial [Candidatus Krumholzibacteria bacterium]|nr:hypothetical protein [Candidatus Krumholzibacteria bacterium]